MSKIPHIDEPARSTPVMAQTQVLVVGGGTAGVAAAVAAAREGADVILVERLGYLGGLATGGMIILLLTLDDGAGKQVVGGLCQETTERLVLRGAAECPEKSEWGSGETELTQRDRLRGLVWGHGPDRVRYSVAYDPEELKFVLNSMVDEAKVRLLLHAYACDAIVDGESVRGAVFQGKAGRFAILADTVVDATGDGDIFVSAGAEFEKVRVLPWLWFCMGGVTEPEKAPGAGKRFFRTVGEGKVLLPWGATDKIARKIDAADPEDLTYAEIECRKQVMQEVDKLRKTVPAFKDAYLCHIADQLGITESRRLVGEYVLTREEMDKERQDTIAITGHWTKYGALYHIPYGSLLPKEFSNLLAAGRCISVDHRVHHATKEIPCCMATGQAAGVAAALSVERQSRAKSVNVGVLQERLERQGAILKV